MKLAKPLFSILRRLKRCIKIFSLFFGWGGYFVALLGTFEQVLQNPSNGGSPIWSSVAGFPFLHHLWYGFLAVGVCLAVTSYYVLEDEYRYQQLFGRMSRVRR